jgi:hypothetical protein
LVAEINNCTVPKFILISGIKTFTTTIFLKVDVITGMSTAARAREKRQHIPSSRLTSDSNAAQPALSSHRQSIVLAQAKKAAEAERDQRDQPEPETTTDRFGDENQSLSTPSSSLPVTPTSSQANSTFPPATDDSDGDSDVASITSTVAPKKKRKRARKSGTRSYHYRDRYQLHY